MYDRLCRRLIEYLVLYADARGVQRIEDLRDRPDSDDEFTQFAVANYISRHHRSIDEDL